MGILEECLKGKKYFAVNVFLILLMGMVLTMRFKHGRVEFQKMPLADWRVVLAWNFASLSIWALILTLIKKMR